jgi:hypothetical protein
MSLIRPSAGWPPAAAPLKAGEWFVVRTHSRQEKILAKELNNVGITAYLLVILESRQYDRRRVDVEVPLFRRVVFVHGTIDDVNYAMQTGRVMSVARAQDQLGLHADFQHLAATLPDDAPAVPEPQAAFASSRKLPATLEPHREVIVRLRQEVEFPADRLNMH